MVTLSTTNGQNEKNICLTCPESKKFLPLKIYQGMIEECGKRHMAPCYGSETCLQGVVDWFNRPPEDL
jgi:hypothetical protein